MAKPTSKQQDTLLSEQYIQNRSYDPDFDVSVTEMLGYDGTNLVRLKADVDGKLEVSGSSGGYEVVGIKDSTDVRINPATEDTLSTIGTDIANIKASSQTSSDELQNINSNISTLTQDNGVVRDVSMTQINPATEETLIEVRDAIGGGSSATNFATYGTADDATYNYVGFQSATGSWYIMRIHKTTGIFTYAIGSSDMATAWADFDTQTYGDWDTYNAPTSSAVISTQSNVTIVDAGGEPATVTDGKLDVNAALDTTGLATSAKQDTLLTELEKKADVTETQPVSAATLPLPTGAATEATSTQTNELIETLQELNHRLVFLAGMANAGAPALRVIPISAPSTAVTGPLTDAQNTAANLATLKLSDTYVGDRAVQSNIINVVVT